MEVHDEDTSNRRTRELWTEQDVSERYRIRLGTLRYWRTQRRVLPYRKLGALVRYDPVEVQAAIDAAKVDVVSAQSRDTKLEGDLMTANIVACPNCSSTNTVSSPRLSLPNLRECRNCGKSYDMPGSDAPDIRLGR